MLSDRFVAQSWARRANRLCAALVAACALSACQHLPSFDSPESKATATQPTKKQTAPRKKAAPQATALRGAQGETVAQSASGQRDATRAGALRATALDQLNRGEVDGAVTNLKAARELDPANELIQRDLERALRIRATVSAQPQ
jgi:hypothetical protein